MTCKSIISAFHSLLNAAAKNPVRLRKNTAEGGCGGNSAVFLQKIEAKPAALLVQSRTQQKSFLFLLEEKIRRAQIRKSEENFFAGWRVVVSGGGLASLVWFRLGISDKMSSSQTVKTETRKEFASLKGSPRGVYLAPSFLWCLARWLFCIVFS